jgi:hypothetical protein
MITELVFDDRLVTLVDLHPHAWCLRPSRRPDISVAARPPVVTLLKSYVTPANSGAAMTRMASDSATRFHVSSEVIFGNSPAHLC